MIKIRNFCAITCIPLRESPSFRSSEFLPPATKFGQGYIFTGVCDSVNRELSASVHAGIPPPPPPPRPGADPPGADPPPSRRPPGSRHPQHRPCFEIQSTHGRYASYWNAILLSEIKIEESTANTTINKNAFQ